MAAIVEVPTFSCKSGRASLRPYWTKKSPKVPTFRDMSLQLVTLPLGNAGGPLARFWRTGRCHFFSAVCMSVSQVFQLSGFGCAGLTTRRRGTRTASTPRETVAEKRADNSQPGYKCYISALVTY